MSVAKPARLGVVLAGNAATGGYEEVRDTDYVRPRAIREVKVGPNGDTVGSQEFIARPGDDEGPHALHASGPFGDEGKITSRRRKQVEHAIERRSRDLRHSQ